MISDYTGNYSPLTISNDLLAAAPKPVTQAWSQVLTAQKRYNEARDLLPSLEYAAHNAPTADLQAEREAAQNGLPMPEPTVQAAEAALDAKRREIRALGGIAHETEVNFLAVVNDHKDAMTATFHAATARCVEEARAALAAAEDAVNRLTLSSNLWVWSKTDRDRTPPQNGFLIPTSAGQTVTALLGVCVTAIDKEHPDEMDRRAAVLQEEHNMTRATPDGLVIDNASVSAYRR